MPRIRCPNCGLTIDLESRKEVDFSQIFNALKSKERTFTELLHITHLPRKTLSLRLKSLSKEGLITKDDGGYHLVGSWKTNSYRVSHVGENMERLYNVLKNNTMVIALVLCLFTYIGVPIMVHALGWLNVAPKQTPTFVQSKPIYLSASFTMTPEPQYANYYYVGYSNIITFDASTSEGDIAEYLWNFGDGSPTGKGQVIIHEYTTPSRYDVVLTIVGKDGSRIALKQTVTVLPYPKTHVYVDESRNGETITVNIHIDNVEDLYGWNFGVEFTNLKVSDITVGDFCSVIRSFKVSENDNKIDYIYGCLRAPEYVKGVSGSGLLATVTFNVLQDNYSISLTNIELLSSSVEYIQYIYT